MDRPPARSAPEALRRVHGRAKGPPDPPGRGRSPPARGIRIIHGRYTRAELQAFIDAVSDEHLSQASAVTSVGQGVRNDDLSPTSRSVIVVGVLPTAITDRLLDDLARSVPRSILQIEPQPRARLL